MASRIVEILVTGNSSQAIAEIEKVAAASETSAKSAGASFLGVGKAATLGLAAAAIGIAAIGVKFAEEGEVASARLKKAADNAGIAWSDYGAKVDEAKSKSRDLGFTGADVSESLTKLVNVTKNSTKSLSDLSLAEDIARGRKIDLSTATDLLTKVESGHVALLGRLGINVKDATGATISQEEAVKRLSEMYGGQASAYADTFQGKLAVIAAQAKYLAAQIGAALIPVLEKLGETLVTGVGFLEKHQAAAIALAVAVGGPLVASMVAWIATQAIAVGSGIITFISTMIGRVGLLVSGFEMYDVALAQNTAQLLANTGATEAEVAAIMQLDAAGGASAVSMAGMAGIVGIAAAAFVGLGVLLDNFIGTGGKFQAVKDAQARGTEEGKRYADTVIAISNTYGSYSSRADYLREKLESLNATIAYQKSQYDSGKLSVEDAAEASKKYETATDALKGQIEKLREAKAADKAATDAQNRSLENAAQSTTAFRDATDKARKAVYDLQDALFGQTDASLAYQKSLADVTDKEKALGDAIRDHGADSAEAKAAELDLAEARNHSAETAAALTKSNDELYNKIKTGGLPAYDAELTRLQNLQAQYPENAAQYQDQIDKLNLVWWTITHMPDYKEVTLKVKTMYEIFGAPGTTSQVGTPYDGYAQGGPVYAANGFFTPKGTDTVPAMLTPGEFVVPKDGALVKGGGSGGNTYNVTVNVPPNADLASIGQATVTAIREYERGSGNSWRN